MIMKTKSLITALAILSVPALALAEGDGEKKGKHCEKHRERMLEKFDADGDGKLSEEERAEAKAAMKAYKEKMIAKYDTDGDGELSEEEKKAAKDAFIAKYDSNGDGKLSEEERKSAKEAGERMPGHKKHCNKGPKGKKGAKGGAL
jgi:Ca2+-binding EF-hand superfamily protein